MLIMFQVPPFQGIVQLHYTTSASLITTLVSAENPVLLSEFLGIMIGVGPVLGPSLGGLLLSLNSWRGIFWLAPFVFWDSFVITN